MLRQRSLLACRFCRHETHARTGDRLADRLGVGCVVLAPANVWLHVCRRHQADMVPVRRDHAGPVMGSGTRFYTDQAGCKFGKEAGHLCSLQLAPDHNPACRVDPMHLEHSFAKVETYRGNLHCGRLLSSWRSLTTTSWHIDAIQQGPSSPINYSRILISYPPRLSSLRFLRNGEPFSAFRAALTNL